MSKMTDEFDKYLKLANKITKDCTSYLIDKALLHGGELTIPTCYCVKNTSNEIVAVKKLFFVNGLLCYCTMKSNKPTSINTLSVGDLVGLTEYVREWEEI